MFPITADKIMGLLTSIRDEINAITKVNSTNITDGVKALKTLNSEDAKTNFFNYCELTATGINAAEKQVIFHRVKTDGKNITSLHVHPSVQQITSINGLGYRDSAVSGEEVGVCKNMTQLETVVLEEGLNYIGESSFEGCSKLSSINVPSSVTKIGQKAFKNCTALGSIGLKDSRASFEIGDWAFMGSGLTGVDISCDEYTIGQEAFAECTNLEEAKLSEGLQSYGGGVFRGCTSLKTLITPRLSPNENNPTLPASFFGMGIDYSENANLPDSLKTIKVTGTQNFSNNAFRGCDNLENIEISANGEDITLGEHCFEGCTSLKSIDFTDCRVRTIPKYCFKNVRSLEEITLDDVTHIGTHAFDDCRVKKINLGGNLSSSDEIILEELAFAYTGFLNELNVANNAYIKTIPKNCFRQSHIMSINLDCIFIEEDAFYNCYALGTVNLFGAINSITGNPFKKCGSLRNISIGESVYYYTEDNCLIDSMTLELIRGYTKRVPSNVTSLGERAFDYLSDYMKTITIPITVTKIGEACFEKTYLDTIYYEGTLSQWGAIEKGTGWYESTKVPMVVCTDGQILANGENIAELTVTSDNRELVGYTGVENEDLIIPSIVAIEGVPYQVTAIGTEAFIGCDNLETVTLPETLITIHSYAFSECSNLNHLTLPNTINTIEAYALEECGSLGYISYNGTIAEWHAVEKENSWDYHTGAYYIICTDGTIGKGVLDTPVISAEPAYTDMNTYYVLEPDKTYKIKCVAESTAFGFIGTFADQDGVVKHYSISVPIAGAIEGVVFFKPLPILMAKSVTGIQNEYTLLLTYQMGGTIEGMTSKTVEIGKAQTNAGTLVTIKETTGILNVEQV